MKPKAHDEPGKSYRFYRSGRAAGDWKTFEVKHRETDLWIRAERLAEKEALEAVLSCRRQLESYIAGSGSFLASLVPLPEDPLAPPVVRSMLEAGAKAGVGPMAAVAGAIAQAVGRAIRDVAGSIIVENGGDCFLDVDEDLTIGVYAGPGSPFKDRVALRFARERFPLGVCTSSGTIGHSLSFGKADAVVVAAKDAALADAAATAVGNMVRSAGDLEAALDKAAGIASVEGVLVLIGDKLGAWGEMELSPL